MKNMIRGLLAAQIVLLAACGTGDRNKTGADPGETNYENPIQEKRDETGDGFTREHEDGTSGAEVGPSPGVDSTTTDSTSIKPRMGR